MYIHYLTRLCYILHYFRDGPYLISKAKQILNLNEEISSMRQRPGESFPAARGNLVAGLSVSLKNRFELDDIIQAMAIANFHTWPLPNSEADNTKETEGYNKKCMMFAVFLSFMHDFCHVQNVRYILLSLKFCMVTS